METTLLKQYKQDVDKCRKSIESMNLSQLFAELDDTIQIDICKMSHDEWATNKDTMLYRALLSEIYKRVEKLGID